MAYSGVDCLDFFLTILDERQECLFKIHGKINQRAVNLQDIKLFSLEILTKVNLLLLKDPNRSESYLLKERHRLLSENDKNNNPLSYENNEEEVNVTLSQEGSFTSFLESSASSDDPLKDYLFVIGSDSTALHLYDNWCLRDSMSIVDVIRILEDRTAQYYLSNDRSGKSFRYLEERNDLADGIHTSSEQWESTFPPSPGSPIVPHGRFRREDLKEICESISLILAPRSTLPTSLLRISIRSTRASDGSPTGKNYTLHHLLVRQDDREWMIQYRHADFTQLHDQLYNQEEHATGYLPRHMLPQLPSKKILSARPSSSPHSIDKRRVKLAKYINTLVSLPGALSNQLICDFLELNNARAVEGSVSLSTQVQRQPRNTIHVNKLNTEARWGDLILFKCNPHSQRARITSCVPSWEWDHVGLVVLSQSELADPHNELVDDSIVSLDILELTLEGVTLYPLTGRLRAYNYNNSVRYMALRKLRSFPRTMETAIKLNEFISSVLGKPNHISPLKGARGRKPSSSSPKTFSLFPSFSVDETDFDLSLHDSYSPASTAGSDSSSYLNAELVISALKGLGIVPKHYHPEYFWPGAFAQNDEIDNLTRETTFGYGEEFIIDCKVMEVNRAVERYSLRKEYLDAASDLLDTLPETQTSFTHTNSSQVPNLAIMDTSFNLDDDPEMMPRLHHCSSYGIPNLALAPKVQQMDPTLAAFAEESSDSDTEDGDELRKAAVRGMPKAQSLKELRFNSKHTVSDGLEAAQTDPNLKQQANEMLLASLDDD